MIAVGIVLAILIFFRTGRPTATPDLNTPYQAVMLTNGQLLFGKLTRLGSAYPVLSDVFYIQSQVNPDTKQVSHTLVKRGKEGHEPHETILNAAHILLIEPVNPTSAVGKWITDAKNR